jgi:hypothetical protein
MGNPFVYDNKSGNMELWIVKGFLGSSVGIYGCTWNGASSLSDPTAALASINDDMDAIDGLEFSGVQITSTRNDQGIAMAFGLTDIIYNGTRYLNLNEAEELRLKVINKLNTGGSSSSLAYQDVVISSSHRT